MKDEFDPVSEFERLSSLEDDDLLDEHKELCAERHRLGQEWREILRKWREDNIPTPQAVRDGIAEDLDDVRACVVRTEFEMARRTELKRRVRTDTMRHGWDYSDRLLAALIFVCERDGQADLVKTARGILGGGWPHSGDFENGRLKKKPK